MHLNRVDLLDVLENHLPKLLPLKINIFVPSLDLTFNVLEVLPNLKLGKVQTTLSTPVCHQLPKLKYQEPGCVELERESPDNPAIALKQRAYDW